MDEMHFDLICYEIQYSSLSNEEIRAHITFPQYVAWRNPRWSEDEILLGIIGLEEKRARDRRRWEEQRDPTPIRSTQLCYSCKAPWEPDHRCRGKDLKHTIEAHYDREDEVCVDGAIDVDSEQSDDDK
jgi:hypothetical protein